MKTAKIGDIVFGIDHYRNIVEKLLVVSMKEDAIDLVVPLEPFEQKFINSGIYRSIFPSKSEALTALQDYFKRRKEEIMQELDERIEELEQMKTEAEA